MMTKVMNWLCLGVVCFSVLGFSANVRKQIRFVDESNKPRTDITQIAVYEAGTSTLSTLYTVGATEESMTNPITTSSTRSGLNAGQGTVDFRSSGTVCDLVVTLSDFSTSFFSVQATDKEFLIPKYVNKSDSISNGCLYVASKWATPQQKAKAAYICDGTGDNEEIQRAIDALWSAAGEYGGAVGGVVVVDRGPYYFNDTVLMRHKVSLRSNEDINHGTKIEIVSGTNKHAFEVCFPPHWGQAGFSGIFVEGNNRWNDNWKAEAGKTAPYWGLKATGNLRGCGFFMPAYAMTLDGPANATYEITSTQMILKVSGVAVPGGTFTLDNNIGSLHTLITAIDALADWTATDITGRSKSSSTVATNNDVVNCTKLPSKCLYTKTSTACATAVNVTLSYAYDYYFNRCMTLHTAQTGFNMQNGHSIHFDRCVSEYVTGDPENNYQGGCGFAIENAVQSDTVRITNCFGHSNNVATYWFDIPDITSIGNYASDNSNTGSYGFRIKDRGNIVGCHALNCDEIYSATAGSQLRNGAGFFITGARVNLSGCTSIDNRFNYLMYDDDTTDLYSTQCVIDGCVSTTSNAVMGTSYGFYVGLSTWNTIANCPMSFATASAAAHTCIYVMNHSNTFSGNVIQGTNSGGGGSSVTGVYCQSYANKFYNNTIRSTSGAITEWNLPSYSAPVLLAVGNSPQPAPWPTSSATIDLTNYGYMSGAAIASNLATIDQTFTLPAATFGMEFTFRVGANHAGSGKKVIIDPAAGEYIVFSGTTMDAGEHIWADNVGDMVKLKCLQTGYWYNFETVGTWTQETP